MQIRDIMTKHSEFIRPNAPLCDVAKVMRDKHIGCVPVGDSERIFGIITDRDIACRGVANALDPKKAMAEDVMSEDVICCYEDQSDIDALTLMEEKGIRHLPVFDRQDHMVGIVSFGDLAFKSWSHVGDLLEIASRDSIRRNKTP